MNKGCYKKMEPTPAGICKKLYNKFTYPLIYVLQNEKCLLSRTFADNKKEEEKNHHCRELLARVQQKSGRRDLSGRPPTSSSSGSS